MSRRKRRQLPSQGPIAPNAEASFRSQAWPAVVIIWCAVIFSLISLSSVLQNSPTVDEPVHLLAGYSYLKWGDFRVNPEHPPLAKAWAALPPPGRNITDSRSLEPPP